VVAVRTSDTGPHGRSLADGGVGVEVDTVRRFNRAYTQRIGVLEESYLGGGRPLGPARLLFELGDGPVGVAPLRRRLGLDSGYVSRLLRELERDRLVSLHPDPHDGRRRVARLTRRGRAMWRRLDERSADVAAALLEPLDAPQRAELVASLRTADRLIRASTVRFEPLDAGSEEARHAMATYFAELAERFRGGFDPVAGGAEHDVAAMRPPNGAFVVARSDDVVVGCGGLQRQATDTAEIKRMWILEDWRGLGLGRRLLADLEQRAAGAGYARVVLDTNETLAEAVAMYRRNGYRAIDRYNDNPYAHHWFEKRLTGDASEPAGSPGRRSRTRRAPAATG
jgi:DNA-binding MarR family transcriptional regulator/GNAT superfamily N-acetyltransferase